MINAILVTACPFQFQWFVSSLALAHNIPILSETFGEADHANLIWVACFLFRLDTKRKATSRIAPPRITYGGNG